MKDEEIRRLALRFVESSFIDSGEIKTASAAPEGWEPSRPSTVSLHDVLDDLESRDEIGYIHTMLLQGSGADRQLKVFRETGDLKAVVDYMAAETRVGL